MITLSHITLPWDLFQQIMNVLTDISDDIESPKDDPVHSFLDLAAGRAITVDRLIWTSPATVTLSAPLVLSLRDGLDLAEHIYTRYDHDVDAQDIERFRKLAAQITALAPDAARPFGAICDWSAIAAAQPEADMYGLEEVLWSLSALRASSVAPNMLNVKAVCALLNNAYAADWIRENPDRYMSLMHEIGLRVPRR